MNLMNIKGMNWHVLAVGFVVVIGGVFYVLYRNQKKMLGLQTQLAEARTDSE